MARMITGTEVTKITRKQLAKVLKQATAIESNPSTGDATEYTATMIGGNRVILVVNESAPTEHLMILEHARSVEWFAHEYRTA